MYAGPECRFGDEAQVAPHLGGRAVEDASHTGVAGRAQLAGRHRESELASLSPEQVEVGAPGPFRLAEQLRLLVAQGRDAAAHEQHHVLMH
jgi:hypothetical protein